MASFLASIYICDVPLQPPSFSESAIIVLDIFTIFNIYSSKNHSINRRLLTVVVCVTQKIENALIWSTGVPLVDV